MSSGKFHKDGLGFTFEVNHQRKQFVFSVNYIKELDRICIRTGAYDYPEAKTSIISEQKILIEPTSAMILFNDKFWEHIPEIMKNISKERETKKDENSIV